MKKEVIRRTEDYTENTKAYCRLPNETTMEHLMMGLSSSEGAVLKKATKF